MTASNFLSTVTSAAGTIEGYIYTAAVAAAVIFIAMVGISLIIRAFRKVK